MEETRYQDIIGGAILLVAGAATAIYSYAHYGFDLTGQVGPGVFPVSLGVILAGLGIAILIPGLARTGRLPEIEWRSLIWVLAAAAVFALLVEPFGMIPSVMGTTLVASIADKRTKPLTALLLAAALAIITVAIFNLGLGVQIHIINWPF